MGGTNDFKRAFGKALGGALKAEGMTQVRLAGELGTDPSRVSRWARGVELPPVTRRLELRARFEGRPFPDEPDDLADDGGFDVFVAAPSRSLPEASRGEHYDGVLSIIEALRSIGLSVFWTTEGVSSPDVEFDTSGTAGDIAAERNFDTLAVCSHLVYIQLAPTATPNGAVLELGYALGQRKRVVILLGSGELVPLNVLSVESASRLSRRLPVVRMYQRADASELANLVTSSGRSIFGI